VAFDIDNGRAVPRGGPTRVPRPVPAPVLAPFDGLTEGDPGQIGGYRISGRLDGAGAVYLGRSPAGQPVRVRVLEPAWASGPDGRSAVVRALRAARRTARLSWTARVLEVSAKTGVPYVVSEHVEGPSLRRLVAARGPLAGADLDRFVVDSLAAVTAVHLAGVVHGSLGPDAVVLGPDGLRLHDVGLTGFGGPGRPGAEPDEAGDVLAWAGTVVLAARGREPDGSAGGRRALEGLRWRTEAPDAGLRGVPLHLWDLLRRCLDADPRRRPPALQAHDEVSQLTAGA
jgi:eukaryotic-like serine/threonine-protein kinase